MVQSKRNCWSFKISMKNKKNLNTSYGILAVIICQ